MFAICSSSKFMGSSICPKTEVEIKISINEIVCINLLFIIRLQISLTAFKVLCLRRKYKLKNLKIKLKNL